MARKRYGRAIRQKVANALCESAYAQIGGIRIRPQYKNFYWRQDLYTSAFLLRISVHPGRGGGTNA